MKVYNFQNSQTVLRACKMALENKMVVLVEGASGLGKTFAFDYFKKKNPNANVFVDELRSTDRAKHPWERILTKLTQDNSYRRKGIRTYDLDDLSSQLVSRLNAAGAPNLVILDEAGFLNFQMLRHFRSLANRTKKSTGYIISGPDYFIKNLKQWVTDQVPGMKELDTRIDLFVKLTAPDYKEKKFVCESEGIANVAKTREISSKVDNFRDLFREIDFYHKGIEGRNEWEWEKGFEDM